MPDGSARASGSVTASGAPGRPDHAGPRRPCARRGVPRWSCASVPSTDRWPSMPVGQSRSTSRMHRSSARSHVPSMLAAECRPGRSSWPLLLVLLVAGLCAAAWLERRPNPHGSVVNPRNATVAALLMAGATTVTYCLVVPPFEPPDELAHFQYARFVATTGTLPSVVPPHDSEWRAASYEFVQQPLYYLGAAVVLRATGLASPGPALMLDPRSRMQPGGTEPTIFQHGAAPVARTGAPGTAPAPARVAADGAGDDVADRTAAHDRHRRPARDRDRGRRPRPDPAVVRRDGRGLDRSAGDAAGRRRHARHRQGRARTDAHGLAADDRCADRRGVCGQGHGGFLVPMALLACALDAANRERLGTGEPSFERARPRADGGRASGAR